MEVWGPWERVDAEERGREGTEKNIEFNKNQFKKNKNKNKINGCPVPCCGVWGLIFSFPHIYGWETPSATRSKVVLPQTHEHAPFSRRSP